MSWIIVLAKVLERPTLGPLLFLIYTKDLSDNVNSILKRFGDDISMCSVAPK